MPSNIADYSIIFSGFSIVLIVILLLILFYFLTRQKSQQRKIIEAKLKYLDKLANSGELYQLKSALMEADKVFDYALKMKKVKGETLGERLKNTKNLFKWVDYQNIWEAHKLRNKMAHEIEFTPTIKELNEKYAYLRAGIKKL